MSFPGIRTAQVEGSPCLALRHMDWEVMHILSGCCGLDVWVPKLHAKILTLDVMVLGSGALGSDQLMRVEPS
jgi:hypothetical protein